MSESKEEWQRTTTESQGVPYHIDRKVTVGDEGADTEVPLIFIGISESDKPRFVAWRNESTNYQGLLQNLINNKGNVLKEAYFKDQAVQQIKDAAWDGETEGAVHREVRGPYSGEIPGVPSSMKSNPLTPKVTNTTTTTSALRVNPSLTPG